MDVLKDFPILFESDLSKNIIYMDSSSTALKPKKVIDKVNEFYKRYTSNIFRGEHLFAEYASIEFDEVRKKTAYYIGADYNEIIFTHNTTDSINKLCSMLNIQKADKIITTILEHHSNYLPWKMRGTAITVFIDENGKIDLEDFKNKISDDIKLAAITFISNVTGNIQPVKELVKICKEHNVLSLIDASQIIGHKKISVKEIGCDFLAFSGHKMMGPSGVGILYVNKDAMKLLNISNFGGGMVDKITDESIKFKEAPYCFEAGTPAIESVIGLGAAIDYITELGIDSIDEYMNDLNKYMIERVKEVKNIVFPFAISDEHVPIFTFRPKNNKADIKYVARILSDTYNVAVNAGYQCCQPLYNKYNVKGAIRASLYIYNTKEDIDKFISALKNLEYML